MFSNVSILCRFWKYIFFKNPKIIENFLFRAHSRKLKPHFIAEGVKSYINTAQKLDHQQQQQQQQESSSATATSQDHPQQTNNMEFLRGVYAFMQVSRSSVSVYFSTKYFTNHMSFFYFNLLQKLFQNKFQKLNLKNYTKNTKNPE